MKERNSTESEIPGVSITKVKRGDAWKAAQAIRCHRCRAARHVIKKERFKSADAIRNMACNAGWKFMKNGKHICPSCLRKDAVQMPDGEAREMTPAEKRKIFRELDANWDEANLRYIDGATDATIAEALSVPRAWVANIRDEDFGPAGTNEEMERVQTAIANLRHEAKSAKDQAMDAAAACEDVQAECDALKKRFAALAASFGPQPRGAA